MQPHESKDLRVVVTSGTIIKTIVYLILFSALFYLSDFIVTLLVAVVIASSIEPLILLLGKFKISRGFAVTIILAAIVILFAVILFVFLPPVIDDAVQFIKTLPTFLESITISGRNLGFKDVAQAVANFSKDVSSGQVLTLLKNSLFGNIGFFATTGVVVTGVVNVILTFVIAFYLAAEEKGVQKFLRLITPRSHEGYIEGLWSRSQQKISRWMQGQLLLSLIVAVLVYIPLLAFSIPYASLLALLAFFGELVPVVGLTLAMIPALVIAFTHGGLQLLGFIFLTYVIVGQLESHIIYPRIMSRAVGVPAVVVIIALIVGAKLAGLWGVLLAVPLASIFMEFVSDVQKSREESL